MKKTDRYSYIGVLTYVDGDYSTVAFPDFKYELQMWGDDMDAMIQKAKESLAEHIYECECSHNELPVASTLKDIKVKENQIAVIITVFMPPYREKNKSKYVKKTLSLPSWLAAKADEDCVNCSKLFQMALMNYLGVDENGNGIER